MLRVIKLYSALVIFVFLSCKKNEPSKNQNNAPAPNLNAQENKFIGTWTQDSVRLIGTSTPTTSIYVSGLKYIFKAEIYCPFCTAPTGAFKGSQETAPNSYQDFVWSAKKQDTLMLGSYYSTMAPEKIYQFTSSQLVLIYKGWLGDSCVAYFHK